MKDYLCHKTSLQISSCSKLDSGRSPRLYPANIKKRERGYQSAFCAASEANTQLTPSSQLRDSWYPRALGSSTKECYRGFFADTPLQESLEVRSPGSEFCLFVPIIAEQLRRVRSAMVPLPQRISSAGQYLSHPQQIRSGCFGWSGSLGVFACSWYIVHFGRASVARRSSVLTGALRMTCEARRATSIASHRFQSPAPADTDKKDHYPTNRQYRRRRAHESRRRCGYTRTFRTCRETRPESAARGTCRSVCRPQPDYPCARSRTAAAGCLGAAVLASETARLGHLPVNQHGAA